MAVNDITACDAMVQIQVDDLLDTPVRIEGFSSDSAVSVSEHVITESRMGVDGKLSSGYVPAPVEVVVSTEANTETGKLLKFIKNQYANKQRVKNVTLYCDLPSGSETTIYYDGVMTSGTVMNNILKVLDKSTYKFTFGGYRTVNK